MILRFTFTFPFPVPVEALPRPVFVVFLSPCAIIVSKGGVFVEYTIKVSDLYQRTKEMMDDKMDFVTISLEPPEEDLPACVSFAAWQKSFPDAQTDYEELDVIPPESE